MKNKLHRDEVWVEGWIAAFSHRDMLGDEAFDAADRLLAEYDKRFGGNEEADPATTE